MNRINCEPIGACKKCEQLFVWHEDKTECSCGGTIYPCVWSMVKDYYNAKLGGRIVIDDTPKQILPYSPQA